MADYKYYYFNIYARGEPTRMLFALADKEYEDVRFPFEEWPKYKGDMPLGQVPVLEVKEGMIVQSTSIARYVAKQLGLFGDDLWEETVSDMICDSTNDVITVVFNEVYAFTIVKADEEPPADLEERKSKCSAQWLKLLNMAEQLQKRKEGGKFINGDKITLADVSLYCCLDYSCVALPDIKTINDWTKQFVEAFESDKRVAKYLKEREPSAVGM